ncbi:MAG: signal peptidase II [Oscillospiraceae bacterium]|nr:signal peptidase II [Oscillospiraceae bacterium]
MEYILIALAACFLDQLVKFLVASNFDWNDSITLIPGLLSITKRANTGMALSMLEGKTLFLGIVSAVVSVVLIVIILRWKLPKWERLSIACVLGGALGNMIDRLFFGYVVDMIDVRIFTFNVADAFITCGAAAFVILYLIRSIKEEKEGKSGDKNGEN